MDSVCVCVCARVGVPELARRAGARAGDPDARGELPPAVVLLHAPEALVAHHLKEQGVQIQLAAADHGLAVYIAFIASRRGGGGGRKWNGWKC